MCYVSVLLCPLQVNSCRSDRCCTSLWVAQLVASLSACSVLLSVFAALVAIGTASTMVSGCGFGWVKCVCVHARVCVHA